MSDETPPNNNGDYWRANLRIVGILMSIWFIVSYGCGILFVDQLNKIQFGGFQLASGLPSREAFTSSSSLSPSTCA